MHGKASTSGPRPSPWSRTPRRTRLHRPDPRPGVTGEPVERRRLSETLGAATVLPMPTRLVHLVVDAAAPAGLARFWSGALAWPVPFEEPDEVVIEPPDDDPAQAGQLPLVFVPVPEPKTSKNRVHLDVASTADHHKAALVARLERLGARQIDIGQPDDVSWVVMAAPEGNEFCVLTPR